MKKTKKKKKKKKKKFDGSSVFSSHIKYRFHLSSLSQPGKAISAGLFVRMGYLKRLISQICNISLKSSVFCIQ